MFTVWLKEQLDARGWLAADLARKSGLTKTAISRLLSGQREPAPLSCVMLSDAFGLDPVRVFHLAGILPAEPMQSEVIEEITRIVQALPLATQRTVLAQLRGLRILTRSSV